MPPDMGSPIRVGDYIYVHNTSPGAVSQPASFDMGGESRAWVANTPTPTEAQLKAAPQDDKTLISMFEWDWGVGSSSRGWYTYNGRTVYGRYVGGNSHWWSISYVVKPPPPPPAAAAPATSIGYTPDNVPLNYLKYLFQQAGCDPRNLTDDDLTVKFWRGLPSMDAIINDIRGYAVAYSSGSGSQAQKDFCQPPSTGPAAQAVYMPPQIVNRNPVKKTITCPSAPLLFSLPTPSIAHNVNLPHYCQRVTDDGGI